MAGVNFSSRLETCTLGVTFVIFASSRIMLTKYSSNDDNGFDYLPAVVTVLAEALKLTVCLSFTFNKLYKECDDVWAYIKSYSSTDVFKLWPWSIPGFFYFLDNLITFYVIASFETGMIVLLNNFVIISTSILFRIILRHKFTRVQWASLFILFLSIVSLSKERFINCSGGGVTPRAIETAITPENSEDICFVPVSTGERTSLQEHCLGGRQLTVEDCYGFLLVLFQCFIASFANVYNEKIFKEGDAFEESIYVQNSRLYLFGVIYNFLLLVIRTQYREKIATCGLFHGFNWFAVLLIFDNAALGLTISLVLKYRDNMFHVMFSQLNTVFIITMSVLFTSFSPGLEFYLQAPIVLLAIYVYNLAKEDQAGLTAHQQLKSRNGVRRLSSSSSMAKMLPVADGLYTDSDGSDITETV